MPDHPAAFRHPQSSSAALDVFFRICTLSPYLRQSGALARLCRPHRLCRFAVPWQDDAGVVRVDTGYHASYGRGGPCLVLFRPGATAETAENLAFLAMLETALLKLGEETFEAFDLSYYDEASGARDHMETVLRFCRNYAARFGRDSVNLLFRGGTGLGKTFLSACIAREVSRQGASVVYETAGAVIAAYEEQKFRGSEEAERRTRKYMTCDLLILDDLGTEMITEFSKSALYTLLNGRLLAGRKTIISTNLAPEDLDRVYTAQIASRLLGEYQDLPFVGRDIRLQKKERGLG